MNHDSHAFRLGRKTVGGLIVLGAGLFVLSASAWPKANALTTQNLNEEDRAICCQMASACRVYSGSSCPDGGTPVGCPCQLP